MDPCDVGAPFVCMMVDVSSLIKRLDVVSCRSDVMTSFVNREVDISSIVDRISVVVSAGPDFVGMFSE